MTFTEAYLFLFCDSLMSSLALLPNTLMAYPTMKIFDLYQQNYMLIIAILGLSLGSTLNYGFGSILHYLKQNVGPHQDSPKFKALVIFINQKLFWLPLLSFLPLLGVIITLASGFFRLRLGMFLISTIIGQTIGILILY